MKIFSILSIIVSTLLIGYLFIVGLPHLAKIEASKEGGEMPIQKKVTLSEKEQYILRDKCNTFALENSFSSANEADAFLENCLNGNETANINVIKKSNPLATTSTNTDEVRLSQDDLNAKCRDFMSHAKFASQKDADLFLKNCLAGK